MSFISWLKKLLSGPPTQGEEDNVVLRTTPVSEVYRLHGTASAVIPEDSPLEMVIARFAGEPSLMGMFLVDSMRRYAGVVTQIDLVKWAHLILFGGKGRHDFSLSEFYSFADAKKAKDICRCSGLPFSVREEDMLQTALDKMLDNEEDVLPILNNRNEIIGDLRLSEILSWMLTKRKE
jgi:CBS-domain-containing membrane protein